MLDQGTINNLLKEGVKFEHTIENQSLIKIGLTAIAVFLIISVIKKFS